MKKFFNMMIAVVCVLSCAFIFGGCFDKDKEPTKSYIVQFYNYDGTLVNEISVEENTSATYEIPTKASTQYYVYEFSNWEFLDGTDATDDLASVTRTLIVRAKFNEVQPTYTINFYDEDGQTLLDTKTVLRGENSSFLSTNPTKLDVLYTYEFDCWVDENNIEIENLNAVQSNINLYAKYNNIGRHSFVVKFYAEDEQTVLKEEIISSGSSIAYTTTKPTSINGYVYDLDYWANSEGDKVTKVEEDLSVYPVFDLNVTDTINNLKYTISEDKTYYTLKAAETKTTSTSLEILSNINSIPVTEIDESTFERCSSLTEIEMPNTITSVGEGAFDSCNNLNSVNFLGALEDWCSITFNSATSNPLCASKAELKINGKILTILDITSVENINEYAFAGCSSLTTLKLGSSVKSVGSAAFMYCDNLSTVTIDSSVKSVDYNAFAETTSLVFVDYLGTINEWVEISFDNARSNPLCCGAALKINNEIITEINVTSALNISDYSFYGCSSIVKVTISCSEPIIGRNAFNDSRATTLIISEGINTVTSSMIVNSTKLDSITLPSSVNFINDYAFYNFKALKNVNYSGNLNSWLNIEFEDKYANPLCYAASLYVNGSKITTLEISELTEIKPYAFYGYDYLTSIILSNNVLNIGDYAFANCVSLTSVELGESVSSIGASAFAGCTSLSNLKTTNMSVSSCGENCFKNTKITEVTFSSSSTKIISDALINAIGQTQINIPESITSFKSGAFKETSITEVNYQGDLDGWIAIDFEDYDSNPLNNRAALKIQDELITHVEITGSMAFKSYVFYGCGSITSITISTQNPSLGSLVFHGISQIIIADNITEINLDLFKGITTYASLLVIPTSVVTINCEFEHDPYSGSFKTIEFGGVNYLGTIDEWLAIDLKYELDGTPFKIGGELVTSLNINTATKINSKALSGCTSLKTVTIGNSVTEIATGAFADCTSLTTVTIGNSVTTIWNSSFYNCSSIKEVNYLGSIDEWVSIDFGNESSNPLSVGAVLKIDGKTVTAAYITTATEVKKYAFYNCNQLTEVKIGNSVVQIGEKAFTGITTLKTVFVDSESISSTLEHSKANGGLIRYATKIYIKNFLETHNYIKSDYNNKFEGANPGYICYYK